ncbi:polysaccharide biosynthesis protein [Xylella fastidiosa subsp. multiplex]|uniref:Polysaccharide biosynthesis protein n=1 Tax=Xylella fastidiosa subsp. multiplex TaxID=644357 RepID=A0A9Q4MHH7_XYLFS|nr:nucleoside-diphosphate sugar epimerase/dehydratase [Xylella fastidiosa]ERI60656.1 multidrug MFS transporter [Xylella fastidiosa subsp. multiplex Griffin-1]ACA12501.1 epimerase/dehydratase protein [Xylella fastidiosa M12]KAJ4853077.1 polysaccharide biosynthesis protein [Xylella fastidiosa subsp. multiplex]MBE0269064.1 polysaccharide biosynthesis protein [Xylella fastidiosa subsp. multiplex]MBE0275836.1 polysaccharide biosynthesis protein [Xylella fastidiosa subsp. multiplex]
MIHWRNCLASAVPKLAVIAHDLIQVWVCWVALHAARYSMLVYPPGLPYADLRTLVVLIAQAVVFWRVGLYRGLWRFASVPDLWNIFKSAFSGLIVIVLVLSVTRFEGVPLSVLVVYPFALSVLLGMPRLLYRAWKDYQLIHPVDSSERVLILGAGRTAEALVRDMRRTGAFVPVGFIDDAVYLRGAKIQGLNVLGRLEEVSTIARETAAKLLVIAIPSLDAAGMQRVVAMCESTGLPFRMVPKLIDVLEGRTLPGELKEVSIEDLLNRKPVIPDWRLIRSWLSGKTVMVTGGGGSIGSEVCRQCARHGASRVVIVEIDELALLTIDSDLRRLFPDIEVLPILGDCGDAAVIAHALRCARPDAVFHAAAYKQVPLLEEQLREAVRNNVLATENVARHCVAAKIQTFVFISTDKAVEPVNVLGATKRYAEMICQSFDAKRTGTRFVTVRFGNVLDSAGSVVPLFREQIRQGGPVTVTHPDVTRYFMTISEACQLILQAAALASHGAIYTLDMGEPVRINLLAEQMIRLAGKQPGRDIVIVYTGLRPGEKMHETLFYADENYRPTAHPNILEADVRAFPQEQVLQSVMRLREAVQHYDTVEIESVISMLMPDFHAVRHKKETRFETVVPFPAREVRRL